MFITKNPISLSEFLTAVSDPLCGAVVSFVGMVRNHNEGMEVKELFYECYEPMANKQIGLIIDRVKEETGVYDIRVIHRVGLLRIGDAAVAIAVSAAHRNEAFRACRAVIDEIKERAPIWKKEIYADGESGWVLCAYSLEAAT